MWSAKCVSMNVSFQVSVENFFCEQEWLIFALTEHFVGLYFSYNFVVALFVNFRQKYIWVANPKQNLLWRFYAWMHCIFHWDTAKTSCVQVPFIVPELLEAEVFEGTYFQCLQRCKRFFSGCYGMYGDISLTEPTRRGSCYLFGKDNFPLAEQLSIADPTENDTNKFYFCKSSSNFSYTYL